MPAIQQRISTLEMKYYHEILRISYRDWVSNVEVHRQIKDVGGPSRDLLRTLRRWKLQWYGHITQSDGLVKMVLQGTMPERRKHGY